MGMNLRKLVKDRDGWRCWGRCLSFLDSRATAEEEDIAIFSLPCTFLCLKYQYGYKRRQICVPWIGNLRKSLLECVMLC
jgi:hypothetical protein